MALRPTPPVIPGAAPLVGPRGAARDGRVSTAGPLPLEARFLHTAAMASWVMPTLWPLACQASAAGVSHRGWGTATSGASLTACQWQPKPCSQVAHLMFWIACEAGPGAQSLLDTGRYHCGEPGCSCLLSWGPVGREQERAHQVSWGSRSSLCLHARG